MRDSMDNDVPNILPKPPVEGRETIEEFLARGGKIKKIDSKERTLKEAGKLTREGLTNLYKDVSYKRVMGRG